MERDLEVIQLAVFKTLEELKKHRRYLWDKFFEFKRTGVVPPPVYTADEFTEGHRQMFAEINNRDYNPGEYPCPKHGQLCLHCMPYAAPNA